MLGLPTSKIKDGSFPKNCVKVLHLLLSVIATLSVCRNVVVVQKAQLQSIPQRCFRADFKQQLGSCHLATTSLFTTREWS